MTFMPMSLSEVFHFTLTVIKCSDEIVTEILIEYRFAEYISVEFVICSALLAV